MSRGQLALVIVLGTFALALILGGGASLREQEKDDSLRACDLDPSGFSGMVAMAVMAARASRKGDGDARTAAWLFFSGLGCGLAAIAVAALG